MSSKGQGLSIAGMVVGIFSLILLVLFIVIPCLWALVFIPGVIAFVGFVLSVVGWGQSNRSGNSKGMAITGTIISVLTIVAVIFAYFKMVHFVSDALDSFSDVKQSIQQKAQDPAFEEELNKELEELYQALDSLEQKENIK